MSRDRVKAYRNGARNSPFKDARDPKERTFRHKMAQAKIYGFLDSPNTTFRRYRNKDTLPARYARAIAYFQQGSRGKALSEVRGLIKEMPDNPWLRELEGQIYYETGLAAQGIAPYRKAVALRPEEPLLLIGLASCLLGKGATGGAANQAINQEAIDNLRAALRIDPLNGPAYLQMSKGYGQLGETALAQWALAEYYAAAERPEARKHAQRALKGLPKGSVEYIRTADILSSIKR
jgi:predicted Zn-dependent protease